MAESGAFKVAPSEVRKVRHAHAGTESSSSGTADRGGAGGHALLAYYYPRQLQVVP